MTARMSNVEAAHDHEIFTGNGTAERSNPHETQRLTAIPTDWMMPPLNGA